MTNHRICGQPILLLLGTVLCAAGMWLYAQRILIPHQVADATAHGRSRGNFSDLYPRWVGARELLLYGRDPYSVETAREIQAGYYGRPLDPSQHDDPKDQQAFAYPVYVVFYLAPTLHLPFETVQRGFFWILLVLTCSSVLVWLRILRWSASPWAQASMIALTLGSLAVMQGLKLQQMSLLVAAFVAVVVALLVEDHPIPAGIVLALATIKPQLVWPLLVWLGLWTAADWKRRYRWAAAFFITMATLFAASEWCLPHWVPRFWQAVRDYRNYTGATSVLQNLVPLPWSLILEVVAGLATALVCWRERSKPPSDDSFGRTSCLVLAMTVLVIPTSSPYNQVLLVPAVLMLARDWHSIWDGKLALRVLLVSATLLIAWPWLSSAILAALSFVWLPAVIQKSWAVPFWTVLFLPPAVVTLALVHLYRQSFAHSARRVPA